MKCMNCGLAKSAHILAPGESGARRVWACPNGSGSRFPATIDVKIELHYQAGEDYPWIAKWVHPVGGPGEVVSGLPADALTLAGRAIERVLEEKPLDEGAIEAAINEKF